MSIKFVPGSQEEAPSYDLILEKLTEVTEILASQNQDKNYDECLGHIITEAADIIDRAKRTRPRTSRRKS